MDDAKCYETVIEHGSYAAASKATGIATSTLGGAARRHAEATGMQDASEILREMREEHELERIGHIYVQYQQCDSFGEAAGILGLSKNTVRAAVKKYIDVMENGVASAVKKDKPLNESHRVSKHYREPEDKQLPEEGKIKRYLLTCAQNNTPLFRGYWVNLLALKEHYDAELYISRFTYAKGFYQATPPKPGTKKKSDKDHVWYAEEVVPYLSDNPVRLAPGIIWCGELNILPTAVSPMTGLQTYTRNESMVVPHVKVSMVSHGVQKNEQPRFGYSTGTVTLRNYIQKKAGQKAEFHHTYGAILVEVNSEGQWWARQVIGDYDGTLHDLDVEAKKGKIIENVAAEAVTFGDIHVAQLDHNNELACWFKNSVAETLRPKHQIFHDVLDFQSRNYHDESDPHKIFEKYVEGVDNVEEELIDTCEWLNDRHVQASKWKGKVVVVPSNHDDFFIRWLAHAKIATDPCNAIIWREAGAAYLRSIKAWKDGEINHPVHPFQWAYIKWHGKHDDVVFLVDGDSYKVCGIENGMHGHLGVGGARGSIFNLKNMGDKLNIGHSHDAKISDGVYQAGTSSKMDMGYNRGPSSWSHSHIVTYVNGKRTMITIRSGKWKA